MKYKYEIGDTVYIRDDAACEKSRFLEIHHGERATIAKIDRDGSYYHIDIGKKQRFVKPEMLVQPAINIYCVGRKVIAQKGDKEGIARCHPDDKFDLMTGAKLALERLEEAVQIPAWLKTGTSYYIPITDKLEMFRDYSFTNSPFDKLMVSRGLAFQTPIEALRAAKKMLKALEERD